MVATSSSNLPNGAIRVTIVYIVAIRRRQHMTNFLLGLLIGVVLGRLFDLWVDWKYPK